MDTRQKNILMMAILFAVFISAAVILNEKTKSLQKEAVLKISIVNSENKEIRFYVEIADNETERQKGLMFRKNLPADRGMLFIFERENILSFWMKNTEIPLDMIFLDSNYNIVDINENAQLCVENKPCPVYNSKKPAKYVLEINAGLAEKNNLKVGDRAVVM